MDHGEGMRAPCCAKDEGGGEVKRGWSKKICSDRSSVFEPTAIMGNTCRISKHVFDESNVFSSNPMESFISLCSDRHEAEVTLAIVCAGPRNTRSSTPTPIVASVALYVLNI
jgi:hypothetical protein